MASARPAAVRDPADPVRLGLIGSGWIGTLHGQSLADRIPAAALAAIADPALGAAQKLAQSLGAEKYFPDAAESFAELAAFVDTIRGGTPAVPTGEDAQTALSIALACSISVQISVQQERPVRIWQMAGAAA